MASSRRLKSVSQLDDGKTTSIRERITGTLADIPNLTLSADAKTNYVQWSKAMSSYAIKNFGVLGDIFEKKKYTDMKPPVPSAQETHDMDNDASGMLKRMAERKMDKYVDLIDTINQNKPVLYQVMIDKLSPESKQKCEEHVDWETCEDSKDPLALLKLISQQHLTGTTGNKEHDAEAANDAYLAVEQTRTETVLQYKKRVTDALDRREECGEPDINETRIAYRFIRKLDPTRFASLQAECENAKNRGDDKAYPSTLLEAYTRASTYVIVKANATDKPTLGATAMAANGSKRNRRDESHGVAKAGKSLSTSSTDSDATSTFTPTSKSSKTKLATRAPTPKRRVRFADTADTDNRSEEKYCATCKAAGHAKYLHYPGRGICYTKDQHATHRNSARGPVEAPAALCSVTLADRAEPAAPAVALTRSGEFALSSVSLPGTLPTVTRFELAPQPEDEYSSDHDDDEVIKQDSNAELTADTELAVAYLATSSDAPDNSAGAAPPTGTLPIATRAAALELQRAPGQQTSPEAILAAIPYLRRDDAIMDTGCTTGVTPHEDMCTNIRSCDPVIFNGATHMFEAHTKGTIQCVGDFCINPNLLCTLVSFSQCVDTGRNPTYLPPPVDEFRLQPPGLPAPIRFRRRHGLYVANLGRASQQAWRRALANPLESYSLSVCLPTVAENVRKLSAREQQEAITARLFQKQMGYPSDADTKTLLSNMRNAPAPPKAVDLATKAFGKAVAALKGKQVRVVSEQIDPTEGIYISDPEYQTLHADVMTVDSIPFLLTVSTPLGYTMVTHLVGKQPQSQPILLAALRSHSAEYGSRNFPVKVIIIDPQRSLSACVIDLREAGYNVETVGSGQHVAVAERRIRVIKERVRAHLHGLPYTLPASLLPWLIGFSVARVNMVRTKSGYVNHEVSPWEAFYRRPIDGKLDVRFAFGDYCQAYNTNLLLPSSMSPRTEGLIALCPTASRAGAARFLNLGTGHVVVRVNFQVLPTPDIVIQYMNQLAATQKFKLSRDPTWHFSGDHIVVEGRPAPAPAPQPSLAPNIQDDAPDADVSLAEDGPGDPLFPPLPQLAGDIPPTPLRTLVDGRGGDDTPTLADNLSTRADTFEHSDQYSSDIQQPAENARDDHRGDDDTDSQAEYNSAQDTHSIDSHQQTQQHDTTIVDEAPSAHDTATAPTDSPPKPTHSYSLRSRTRTHIVPDALLPRSRRATPKTALLAADPDHEHTPIDIGLHVSLAKALRTYGDKAKEALVKELRQMFDKGVWEVVDTRKLSSKQFKSIIRSSFFLKEKFLPTGDFDKLKGRLVGGGHMQDKTVYGDEISSPTVSLASILMVAAIAASERRHVATVDITGAYLNASMEKTVHMRLEPALADVWIQLDPTATERRCRDGSIIVRLRKALYGCVESAKLWYKNLRATLESDGFSVNGMDQCVFNKTVNGKQVTVSVYVDDLLITCVDQAMVESTIELLRDKYIDITVHRGDVHSYIGMTMDFSNEGKVHVSMTGYTQDILDLYSVKSTATSPATSNLFTIDPHSPRLPEPNRQLFHSAVAKLLYIAKRTRPELLPMVSFLASRVSAATDEDMNKLKRGLSYLKGSPDKGIVLESTDPRQVLAYIDASFAVHADMKSHTAVVLSLGLGPICVESVKQKLVSRSSTEAELIALSDGLTHAIWAREWIICQGYKDVPPVIIYQDNLSTKAMAEKGMSTSKRTRHINIKYFFVHDRIERNEVQITYLPTEQMVADILSKPIQGQLFRILLSLLLNDNETTD